MSSEKSPAFRFYVDNFVEGTCDMTDQEVGLYMRLLCAQWSRGGLPDDDSELLRFSRGSTTLQLKRVKSKFLKGGDGLLRNDRLEAERLKQAVWQAKSAEGGRKSAELRKNGSGLVQRVLEPPLQPQGQPKGNIPLPLPLPPLATSKEVAAGASAPTAVKSKRQPLKLPDGEWLDGLKSVAAYSHIDIRREFSKAEVWISAKPGRKLTRPFFINWLNRIEPPVKPVNGAKFNPWQKEEERGLICH